MARKERAGIVANPLHAVLFFSMFIIGTAVLTFAKAFLNDGHGYFVIAASFILMMFYGVLVTLVPLTKLRLDRPDTSAKPKPQKRSTSVPYT